MKLIEYMRREGLDDEAMAAEIGDCTAHAVKKWKYGERVPDAERIVRIQDVTNGAVRLKDWLPDSREAVS